MSSCYHFMKKILFLTVGLCGILFAEAQDQAVAVLQKTIDKVNSLKALDYAYKSTNKNLFSDGDTSYSSGNSIFVFDGHGKVKALHDENNIGKAKFRNILKDDTLFKINVNDSTYTFYPKPDQNDLPSDLFAICESITNNLHKKTPRIFQHKDTIIDKISCYCFYINEYDTTYNGQHDYTYIYIFINKASNMPVMFKKSGAGVAEKAGHVIGRVTNYDETHFSNFRVNGATDEQEFYFDRTKFSLPNDKMLADGDKAPLLKLTSLEDQAVAIQNFQNKLLLIEFGDTGCPANALANPLLNRLKEKYASKDFLIACVYTGETAQQAKNYIKTNGLKFPVYLTDSKTRKSFKTIGTPGFYLVGKNGMILMSSNGYSDELEQNLSVKIEAALKK